MDLSPTQEDADRAQYLLAFQVVDVQDRPRARFLATNYRNVINRLRCANIADRRIMGASEVTSRISRDGAIAQTILVEAATRYLIYGGSASRAEGRPGL